MMVDLTCTNADCSEAGIAKGPIEMDPAEHGWCGVCQSECDQTPADTADSQKRSSG